MALMLRQPISKPKSKPANASRLQNQNAKDNQSQTANEVLSYSQSIMSLHCICLSSRKFSPQAPVSGMFLTISSLVLPYVNQ